LRGRVVVITGGGSGIGKALAMLCAGEGWRVAVLDRDAARADETAAEAARAGAARAMAIGVDVSREEEVRQALERVEREMGVATAVFAGAGIDRGGAEHELPGEVWRAVLATNLDGVFHTCKHSIAGMLRSGVGGSIVCASSPAAFVGFAAGGAGAYSASKGGVTALVRCLAVGYARHGIRVNAVVPGATETPMMWANVAAEDMDGLRGQVREEIPLGRLADPSEPARAALWLLSDAASYVTGSQLVCDGGILAKASISF
jgi:NAD(P)-dependent dehydrogenase (short-subunit alcohol dehydrogenase family)